MIQASQTGYEPYMPILEPCILSDACLIDTNTEMRNMTKSKSQKIGVDSKPILNNLADAKPLSIDRIYGTSCVHGESYGLCQQCEIRIREQDLLDRLIYQLEYSYTSDSDFRNIRFKRTNDSIAIRADIPDYINNMTLKYLEKEFSLFYIDNYETPNQMRITLCDY